MSDWKQVQFKNDIVWAKLAADGAFAEERGLVPFCYTPGGKVYRTRAERLEAYEDAEIRSDMPAPAPPKPRPGSAKRGYTLTDLRPEDQAVQVWTDGACTGNPGPAGAGVLIRHHGNVQEISESLGMATNNIAELTAILRGLQAVKDAELPVDVVTDSSYCIGLLTQGWKAKANQALVAEVRTELGRFSDVRLVKVKGHAGVDDNERADELARQGVLG